MKWALVARTLYSLWEEKYVSYSYVKPSIVAWWMNKRMNIGVGFLGGLMFHDSTVNMQYVTTASLLLTVYSRYLSSAKATINCGGTHVTPAQMSSFAKQQVSIRISLIAMLQKHARIKMF